MHILKTISWTSYLKIVPYYWGTLMLFAFWSMRLRPLVHTNFPSKIVSLWVSPKSKSTFYAHSPLVRRIGYRPILCISLKAIGRYHYLKKANLRVRPCVHNTAHFVVPSKHSPAPSEPQIYVVPLTYAGKRNIRKSEQTKFYSPDAPFRR